MLLVLAQAISSGGVHPDVLKSTNPPNVGYFKSTDKTFPPMLRLTEYPKRLGGGQRRCVFIYTYWEDAANYERLRFCTVPFRRNSDIGFLPEWPQREPEPDPRRMLESPLPVLECEGKGCDS
jgi:hypothetical protein